MLGTLVKELFPSVVDLIDDVYTSDEEQDEMNLKKLDMVQRRESELLASEDKRFTALIDDKVSARNMQKSALQQNDKFAKRFVYYLAITIIISTMAMMYAILREPAMADSPSANLVLGGLISITTTVVSFFFGSSLGSKQKTDIMGTYNG